MDAGKLLLMANLIEDRTMTNGKEEEGEGTDDAAERAQQSVKEMGHNHSAHISLTEKRTDHKGPPPPSAALFGSTTTSSSARHVQRVALRVQLLQHGHDLDQHQQQLSPFPNSHAKALRPSLTFLNNWLHLSHQPKIAGGEGTSDGGSPAETPPSSSPFVSSFASSAVGGGGGREANKVRGVQTERQSLSDISQELLAQIIRFFPFSSPSPNSQRRCPSRPSFLLFRAKSTSFVHQLKKQQNGAVRPPAPPGTLSASGDLRPIALKKPKAPKENSLERIRRVASNLSLTSKARRERPHNLPLFGDGKSKPTAPGVAGISPTSKGRRPATVPSPEFSSNDSREGHQLKLRKKRRRRSTTTSEFGVFRESVEVTEMETISEATTFDQLFRWALLQVSVDTMAITALPLDCWLKERLKNWVQLSGHEGTIVPASNHTLWKKQPKDSQTEARAYAEITEDPSLHGITPKFYKEIAHNQESFIEIQDLLAQFPNTERRAIMDIKIGTRTFMESEVNNSTKRVDLYQKMVALAPDEPTEAEQGEGKVTKLRYMQFRERESSSAALGFRIEAAQLPGGKLQKNFKKIKSRHRVRQTLTHFFDEGADDFRPQLIDRLRQIREAVERSEFFRSHEVVGSSILIIYDEKRIGAWLIDFAKCTRLENGQKLNHRTPWTLGNHEDGWLTGLDNLIELLAEDEEESDRSNH
uniref:Kinase n=1 Tax=Globodera pallida TaxID=36090 RepID=A0A183CD39_GLOPA